MWSKYNKPNREGIYPYRSSPSDPGEQINVVYRGSILCAELSSHTEPVPLADCPGEWIRREVQDIPDEADIEDARRTAASDAGNWLRIEVAELMESGAGRAAILERVTQLARILEDWRADSIETDRDPWEWAPGAVDAYLAQRPEDDQQAVAPAGE